MSKSSAPREVQIPTERERIRALRGAATAKFSQLAVGIGDDAAILRPRSGEELAVTTDLLLENTHFHRDWHPAASAGHRCLARGLSDIAAMGARPLAAFLSVAFPKELAGTWADEFFAGLLALARHARIPLAGGDLASSPKLLTADITILGALPVGAALLRSHAGVGDGIFVTGTLGGAVAGLDALRRTGKAQQPRPRAPMSNNIRAQQFPEPRLRAGLALQRIARAHPRRVACMDISDGLAMDLHRMCEASGVGAELIADDLPVAPGATRVQALYGGDDYELLFTLPPAIRAPRTLGGVPVTRIGTILRRKQGIRLLDSNGRALPVAGKGWEYFAS